MANIKVKELNATTSVSVSNKMMVLTNETNNTVQNVTVEDLISNLNSTDANNGITIGTDKKLFVDNADTGVTAGTYEYPRNLVVDAKGKITSLTSGSPASVPIATSSAVGVVKPDNSTITVANDGTITANIDTSTLADYNLSNLTATGKTKVVTLAYELDFANAVSVSTTASASWVSYTAAADGILFVESNGSSQQLYARIMYDGTTNTVGAIVSNGNSVGTCFPMVNGQTVKYQVYGGTSRSVTFIPFKKA